MVIADELGTKRRLQNFLLSSCLLLVSLAALAFALYPIYIIRPFREQEPAALARALWVVLHGKLILFALCLPLTTCALIAWRRAGWVARLLLAPCMAIALIAAVAPWVNPYEQLMFHPFGAPRYVSIRLASVDPKDMVIAVTLDGESRVSHPRNGIPPYRERSAASIAHCCHVLNALSYGSGLDPQHTRA